MSIEFGKTKARDESAVVGGFRGGSVSQRLKIRSDHYAQGYTQQLHGKLNPDYFQ